MGGNHSGLKRNSLAVLVKTNRLEPQSFPLVVRVLLMGIGTIFYSGFVLGMRVVVMGIFNAGLADERCMEVIGRCIVVGYCDYSKGRSPDAVMLRM